IDNFDIYGSGFKGNNLRVLGAYNYFSTNDNGINFYVDGPNFTLTNSENFASYYQAFYFDTSADTGLIKNVNTHDIDDDCIYMDAPNLTILNSTLNNCAAGNGVEQYYDNLDIEGSHLFNMYDSCVYSDADNLKLVNTDCSNAGNESADPAITVYGDNFQMFGGTVSNSDYSGIYLDGTGPALISGVHISNITDDYC